MKLLNKKIYITSPLPKECRFFLWVSTFLSLMCLSSVINIPLAVGLLIVFVGISTLIKHTFWSPWKRLMLFAPLMLVVGLQVGALNRELGTALLAVTMIVKYIEIRSRKDIAMLLLCNTLAPFVAFLQKENAVLLVLGALTLIFALMAAQAAYSVQPRKNPLRVAGSVVMWFMLAIPFTGTLYLLTPRVDNPLWGGMHNRSKTGVGDEMNVAQWTELFNDLSTAFRVRYTDKIPRPQDMYFRGTTLWSFDGQVWSSTPTHTGAVTAVSSLSEASTVKYSYNVSYVASSSRVYAMDFPVEAPKNILMFSDGQMRSATGRSINAMLSLKAGDSIKGDLTAAERKSALQLPAGFNPRTVQQAKSWRKQFSSDEQYIDFVMKNFSSRYQYSLAPPPLSSPNVVDSFMFDTKTGFCAHYSSAFAVLMRSANIPTRVVNGYLGSEMDDLGGYFRIRQADAHAWNEVWLNGRWVRFDPTNQVTTIRNRSDMTWDLMNQTYSLSDWLNARWSDQILAYDEATQEELLERFKQLLLKIPALGVGCAIAVVVVFIWLRLRPFRLKRLRAEDRLANDLNMWFAQFPDVPVHLGWRSKLDKIATQLNSVQYTTLLEIVEHAEEILYGQSKVSPRDVRKKLKALKKPKR